MSIESVSIRRAASGDADQLHGTQILSQQAVDSRWRTANDWHSLFNQSGVYTYLAEAGHVFGAVTNCLPTEEWLDDGKTGEVFAWFLHPDYQGHGLGRKLLVHGLTVIKRRQLESAIIWIPEFAERATEIVDRLNFEKVEASRTTNLSKAETSVVERCWRIDLGKYF